ncbi:MAG: hypothetical protein GY822_06360 [Deltaproteobacteria bacterium]|nr:hypothetical protein [Deltaproteobacteria bacterium]
MGIRRVDPQQMNRVRTQRGATQTAPSSPSPSGGLSSLMKAVGNAFSRLFGGAQFSTNRACCTERGSGS